MSIVGLEQATVSATCRRASSMGSIRCEWKACEVASGFDLMPCAVQAGQDFVDGRGIAGNDDALRPVQRGDRDPVAVGLDRRGHLRLRGENRGHPPAGRQRLHEPGPLGDQADAVLQREHAGHAGRRELATLCPSTAAGSIPQLRQSAARAYSRANITGCV